MFNFLQTKNVYTADVISRDDWFNYKCSCGWVWLLKNERNL